MKGKVFKESKSKASYFDIERNGETICINSETEFYLPDSNEDLMDHMEFHIANVPEVLKGLDFVFHAPDGRGEIYKINKYGDNIALSSITDPVLKALDISVCKNNIRYLLSFNLSGFDFPTNESERVYTPAMLWVTKQLKKIYNDWQKEHPEYERIK
ncbi:MAG: hypothetical protein PUC37_04460 [Spirochaetales bacterium]|nr:hypothetical protein [Spirochaetales bacterium]